MNQQNSCDCAGCVFLTAAVCVEASSRLEVKGHAGGEVSIHCSGNWTASGGSERSSVYFCRGVCSGENVLIRSEGRPSGVTQRGRYSADIDRRAGVFTVTIKNLRSADAGLYHCGAGTAFNVTHQFEISLTVLDGKFNDNWRTVSLTRLSIHSGTSRGGCSLNKED
uniref:Immunoglobulin domain-containing protein n=1 Tax=Salarias fasciatus TaxID=181472 RepID=A0A672HIW7_SALFA